MTINPNQVNEFILAPITIQLVDPCDGFNVVSLAEDLGFASEVWITTSNTFAIDPNTQLSSVSTPAGASCGSYTVEFTLVDQNGDPAPETATITVTDFSYTINFNFDIDTTGNWDISVTAYHTNYPNASSATATYRFLAKNPCQESTIQVDTTAVAAAWPASQSIHESTDYFFNESTMTTVTIAGPDSSLNCGALVFTFSLTPNSSYLTTTSTTATVDFASATSAVSIAWSLSVTIRFAGYSGAADPKATLAYSIGATDPCNDAAAVTLGTAYLNSLATTYDLF